MKNKIIIFTGPSGVGKATIEKELFKDKDLNLCLSISATTRAPRSGETNGVEYYFITQDDFKNKINNNEFVEHSEHFSNLYGTLKSEIKRIFDNNQTPLLEIETNGARNVMKQMDKDEYVTIFMAPPSRESLIERIRARGTESEEQLKERVSRLDEELSHSTDFQYIVTNDKLENTIDSVKRILEEEL